jgi:hypothetical protein
MQGLCPARHTQNLLQPPNFGRGCSVVTARADRGRAGPDARFWLALAGDLMSGGGLHQWHVRGMVGWPESVCGVWRQPARVLGDKAL